MDWVQGLGLRDRPHPRYIIGVLTPQISTPPSARMDLRYDMFASVERSHKPSASVVAEPGTSAVKHWGMGFGVLCISPPEMDAKSIVQAWANL